MEHPVDFQSILMRLQSFWAEQGCLIWQPYYTQVGAGTMNPATFLRVLGPEPWNVAYVEPSIRPDDGRYGENPNRFQQHYQFQVILKPDPGSPQELYLRSLEALGIDSRRHDIRFVEDNWESPALGAWGLGWEVWLDGQEITQFTYFQQAGGLVLDPVSVEITYGMERIAMALQRVQHFRNLRWSEARTYGDVNFQGEQEHSRYYFEIADVDRLRQMYDLFEAEAEAALNRELVLPAHDYILKCSHTFNVLDTRGAVGVTERQALFSRMRELARRTAEAYLAQREALGFPWLDQDQDAAAKPESKAAAGAANRDAGEGMPAPESGKLPFLLEIGSEELPAADLQSAIDQLQARLPALLAELRLEHSGVHVMGTPRRLVVWLPELDAHQPDCTAVHRGPPASRAFDADGKPTPAAEGFARSKGLAVEDLDVREVDGGKYAVALVKESGRPARDVLQKALPGLVSSIHFEKSMRWNASNVTFSRPIRWLLALLGERVVPFEYAGLRADRITRGLRFHEPELISVTKPEDYFKALELQAIQLDPQQRQQTIADQVKALTAEAGGEPRLDMNLLLEVTHLVEVPTALRGGFEESHLHLPPEVLVSVMKKHQRYFPVWAADGSLLPNFIAVRNGDGKHLDVVTDGNEQVIRARFEDADFFIKEDLKFNLDEFVLRLASLTFQFKLGSMLDKSRRVEALAARLGPHLGLDAEELTAARRAAQLCKADLVSHMVVEMTSLQGIMGKFYARRSGEADAVADAIFEHYLPRFAGDDLPRTRPGLAVGVADRLDSLAGLFSVGLVPSGTKDPFALRRAALGLVQNLMAWELPLDLRAGLALAADNLPIPASPESRAACLEFITGRLRGLLTEQGYRYDVVEAVLAAQGYDPSGSLQAVKSLSGWVRREDWNTILPAYARCVRITRDQPQTYEVNPEGLHEEAEKALYQVMLEAQEKPRLPGSVDGFLNAFLPMIAAINRFFDTVLVMDEDASLRSNRLGMLQRIAALAEGVADLSALEGF